MKPITQCRACASTKLTQFLDLGKQYLSDFRADDSKPSKYPLVAVFCESCALVQLLHTTPSSEMYHENYGFKSGISNSIKDDLNEIVTHAFQYKNDPKNWLDIASNDGTLLSFVPDDVYRVGVDPISRLCGEATKYANWIINGFFRAETFAYYEPYEGQKLYQQFDVITSISCFYDMDDPNKFVDDVAKVLSDTGVWIIQQNYLLTTMELSAVDNFCHEHLEYYTLLSLETLLEKHGLEVNEVVVTPINGGSIRTVVSKKGIREVDQSVYEQRGRESRHGLDDLKTYIEFAASIEDELNNLRRLVTDLHNQGKQIAILAASTRGATIWQSAGIEDLICYAVERNPEKVGRNFSAIGVAIISEEEFRERQPEYAIIGPWFFADEIIDREYEYLKAGGKLIIPLPTVTVMGHQDLLSRHPESTV